MCILSYKCLFNQHQSHISESHQNFMSYNQVTCNNFKSKGTPDMTWPKATLLWGILCSKNLLEYLHLSIL